MFAHNSIKDLCIKCQNPHKLLNTHTHTPIHTHLNKYLHLILCENFVDRVEYQILLPPCAFSFGSSGLK